MADHARRTTAPITGAAPRPRDITVSRNEVVAMIPAPVASAPRVAARKGGDRKSSGSIMGASRRCSTTSQIPSSTRPPSTRTITSGRVGPPRASTRPVSSTPTPAASSTTPGPSTGRGRSARDSSSTTRATTPRTTASRASSQYEAAQPPISCAPVASSGPTAIPAPSDAPHTPLARRASCEPAGKA